MKKISSTKLFDFYAIEIENDSSRFKYFFEIEDLNGEIIYLMESGLEDKKPEILGFFQFPYILSEDIYEPITWVKDAIVYQIFIDRFANKNNLINKDKFQKWGSRVTPESVFGGNLLGIKTKLNYLINLGINTIYISPIFSSKSNHKYNINNYFEVDIGLGNKNDLRELINECHKFGIKVILDAVFNHSGADFFAFKDILKNGVKSKYKDWYYIKFNENGRVINYIKFNDNWNMPKINLANKSAREYFLNVAKYWIKEFQIDGWRLDVCDEISHDFWREFRKVTKSINKDLFIIGEIYHEGKSFLLGDQLDSVMNYKFRDICLDFFAYKKIDAKTLNDKIILRKEGIRDDIYSQLLNVLDSHDTKRFFSECDEDKNKFKLATIFQFTIEGIPYIYYGDEVGITGSYDPDCRKCMIWDENYHNKEIFNHFKKLIELRKNIFHLDLENTSVFLVKEM